MNPTIRSFTINAVATFSLTLLSAGCGHAPAKEAAPAVTTSAEGESAGASIGTAAAADASSITAFGVPECDKYVTQFLACVEGRVSGEQKATMMEAFDANRVKWRAMSTIREGAVALTVACRAVAQKSKEELAVDYGCEF